jgi:hypothetical protein
VQRTNAALRSARFPYPVCPVHFVNSGSRSARRQGLSANPANAREVSASHPPRLSVELIAAPIGYFVSFSMPKGRELTRYCPTSFSKGVGAKRRRDVGAKLAKDILAA